MPYLLVLSTVPDLSSARKLAKLLLKKKLAACITLTAPVESHYVWKGKRERSKERLLLIKTKQSLYRELEDAMAQAHPYEVPEILGISISRGRRSYLRWLEACL